MINKKIGLLFLLAWLMAACTSTASPSPTVSPTAESPKATESSQGTKKQPVFPAINDKDWTLGAADAKITIIEYSDFQCPYCGQIAPVLSKLMQENPKDLRFAFRHFPLPSHDKALLAAQAAEAAGVQKKFWELSEVIFTNQQDWSGKTTADFETWLSQQSKKLGLDEGKFSKDLKSDAIVNKVKLAQEEANSTGVSYTPFLLVNGRIYDGTVNFMSIKAFANLPQYEAYPPMTIDVKKQYQATLKTEKGDIVINLFADKAPKTVNSFIFLAQKGWYNGMTFHRVIPNFVAQTGDPTGTGSAGPGYEYENEIVSDLKYDKEGLVGMANAGPDTNGSQFFITYAPLPNLDGGYTIFGQVTKGMDVARKITARDPSQNPQLPAGDKVLEVTIQTP